MGKKDTLIHTFFGKFRTKLFVLVLLPMLPALALALHRNFEQRRSEKARVLHEISSISSLIAAKEVALAKNAKQLLATLSGLTFLVEASDKPFVTLHFQNLAKLLPDYLNFGLVESNGTFFAGAIMPPSSEPVLSLSDRSYFRRAVSSGTFSLGEYQVGRLTQQRSVNFGFPVYSEAGIRRVLFASLDLSRINEAAAEIPLPPGAVVTIFDTAGTVVGYLPDAGGWIGHSAAESPLARNAQQMQRGTFESAGLDGVNRVYAVMPVSDGKGPRLFVTVGVPTNLLFAEANALMRRNLIFMGIIVIAALYITKVFADRVFVDPINGLATAALRLSRGDLNARAPIIKNTQELGELSSAFNTMASHLEQRDRELNKAHAEIQRMNGELEQKVQERTSQLLAANQELEAFSYSVSHDLRAPLRHLDGFSELLKRHQSERLDEKGKRHLEVIGQAARKMGVLIDELLVFSRMGRQELRKSTIDVEAMVRECIRELAPDYQGRKIEWIVGKLRPVEADPAMLKQVWLNLLSNAIKYSRPREASRIEIGSSSTDRECQFFVRDNGVGFDMQYADKLFGVFQRLHADHEFEGTGIGLANVRRIILRHGGRTWAESIPDQGSTFHFSLPEV